MRTKTLKINGKKVEAVLVAGITGLVKVYSISGHDKYWLCVKGKFFTLQDELDKLVGSFVTLKYQPEKDQDKILSDFKKICEVYL